MSRRYRTLIAIGEQFGYWTVIGTAAPVIETTTDRRRGRCVRRQVNVRQFLCRCRCGTERPVKGTALLKVTGSKSCGCYHRERTRQATTTHGATAASVWGQGQWSPEYRTWIEMRRRCYKPKTAHFAYYGGRGISVCDEWRDDFAAFFAYMGPKPTRRHSIDRIDNDGHYEPGNVRWATQKEQVAKQRRCKKKAA